MANLPPNPFVENTTVSVPSNTSAKNISAPTTHPAAAFTHPAQQSFSSGVHAEVKTMQNELIKLYNALPQIVKTTNDNPYILNMLNRYTGKPFNDQIKLLSQFGGQQSNKPDGQWGPHTQTSLEAAKDIAMTMAYVSQYAGIKLSTFNVKDFLEMKSLTDKNNKTSVNEKASKLTILIDKLVNGVSEFANDLSTKAKDLSTQSVKPLTKLDIPKIPQEYLNHNIPNVMLNVKGKQYPITYQDLANSQSFQQYLGNIGIDPKQMINILNSIKTQLQNMQDAIR